MKNPELLSPCGSPETLQAAVKGGADAVYLGGNLFNARMKSKKLFLSATKTGSEYILP
jgi:putative protease